MVVLRLRQPDRRRRDDAEAISAQSIRDTWANCYPNLQLEVLANAGHDPMHETPVALATSVESFLAA